MTSRSRVYRHGVHNARQMLPQSAKAREGLSAVQSDSWVDSTHRRMSHWEYEYLESVLNSRCTLDCEKTLLVFWYCSVYGFAEAQTHTTNKFL